MAACASEGWMGKQARLEWRVSPRESTRRASHGPSENEDLRAVESFLPFTAVDGASAAGDDSPSPPLRLSLRI